MAIGGLNVQEIAAPSPATAGGVWRAPLGTTLPTDSTTALDAGFVGLGFVDDDGITINEERPQNTQFAWGGGLIASLQQSYRNTFHFKLMQPLDPDVQKAVHSDTNVTVTAATISTGTLIATKRNAMLNVNSAWVFEGYYQLSTLRIVVPDARCVTIAPIKWTHKTLALYDVTLESFPDSSNNFSYLYTDDGIVT